MNENNPIIGWHNLVTPVGIDADHELPTHPAVRLANPSTAELWRSDSTDPQSIVFPVSDVAPIDYVGIAVPNFAAAGISLGLDVWDIGESQWAEAVEAGPVTETAALIRRFDPVATPGVRLRLGAGSVPPEAAVLYIGQLLVLERRIYVGHVPMPMGRRSRVINGRSERGDFLGRVLLSRSVETAVDLQNLSPAWVRQEMVPFLHAAETRPFFFSWRPGTYPDEAGFAWLTNEPQPSNQRPNGMMQVQLQMGGIV